MFEKIDSVLTWSFHNDDERHIPSAKMHTLKYLFRYCVILNICTECIVSVPH